MLPKSLAIIGVDAKTLSDESFREHLLDGVRTFCKQVNLNDWNVLAGKIKYLTLNLNDTAAYEQIAKLLSENEKLLGINTERAFYLAVPSGVVPRIAYYEHAGAVRDMIQNHLIQILCFVAMEPPVSFDADEIRGKEVDVLQAIRPLPLDKISQFSARGQYGRGWIEGKQVPRYRDEPGVSPQSSAETFAALKLHIDNWRWQDVPFYLRTGKRLPERVSQVVMQFRPVPHQSFPASAVTSW